MKVHALCGPRCGVEVRGEIDSATREFIHSFSLPPGAESLVTIPRTEVERVRLATFAPDAEEWALDCPVCRSRIRIGAPPAGKSRA